MTTLRYTVFFHLPDYLPDGEDDARIVTIEDAIQDLPGYIEHEYEESFRE